MIWGLLALHVVGMVAVFVAADRRGPGGLVVGAIPPAVTAVWAATVLGADPPPAASVTWVAGLDLSFTFQVDDLAALMTLMVSGVGALVFVYASGYFSSDAIGLGRFGATLLAFSTAMVGLVWSQSVWTLFVFWELTSVTSFLLVGQARTDPVALAAARRALMITVAGGLALLPAFVILVDLEGSADLSALEPVGGTSAAVAAVLVLVAAATKSAQVPFHVWLPGAMVAPTPVSAYLHSATMVKAGVLLVALLAPALGEVAPWTTLGLTFGLVSMVWGAVGALRQVDAKLVLAWGTISQLGLMIALLSLGTAKATFAAVSLVAAHALFKAALFLVVGEVDVRTGTRELSRLSGLWRSMPVAFSVALVAALSMAGVIGTLGFAAKEAAIEATFGLTGPERLVVPAIVIAGSVLTVAYTVRLMLGLFGTAPGVAPTTVGAARPRLTAPAVVLAAAGVAGYGALGAVTGIVGPAATELDAGASAYSLLRWPGLTDAFVVSTVVVVVGVVLGVAVARHLGTAVAPRPLGAERVDRVLDGLPRAARRLTARVQHGSLPAYLATMAFVVALAAVPFVGAVDLDALELRDEPLEPALGLLVVVAAAGVAIIRSRLGAALALGVVGIAMSGLFIALGAPDLALTQLLVETVIVVGFVIGLGSLARRFPVVGLGWRGVRLAAAALVGTAVAVGLAGSASAPSGRPPVDDLVEAAVDEGGGNNVVNVILTDIRALDTLGEIMVLAVVAVGILALARAGRTGEPR